MSNIIAILTIAPTLDHLNAIAELVVPNYEIYVFVDRDDYNLTHSNLTIIRITNCEARAAGFYGINFHNSVSQSRDKAMYYFHQNPPKSNVWFLEDDVFVPTSQTIPNLDSKYPVGDLLSARHTIVERHNLTDWPHWPRVIQRYNLTFPMARSLVCGIRVSPQLLAIVTQHIVDNRRSSYCEVIYNTLALQHKLKVVNPFEMSTIKYRHPWTFEQIETDHLYHPVKDLNLRKLWFQTLKVCL